MMEIFKPLNRELRYGETAIPISETSSTAGVPIPVQVYRVALDRMLDWEPVLVSRTAGHGRWDFRITTAGCCGAQSQGGSR
jgi:hypothetical protein